ncbi:transglutaminase family protein [Pseudoxanthomonas wuyuanensis]
MSSRTDAAASSVLDAGSRIWVLATAGLCLAALLLQLPGMLGWSIAAAAALIAALSWRRPLHAVLRLLLALAMLAAVLTVMGMRFGRDTGCALLAAMLAIKPAETGSLRDARSLIGFALFAPFAAFLLDQGPLTMVIGLLGVLSALMTLQRLAELEGGVETAPVRLPQRLSAVGRLVALGLPLMLAAFWLFPRFPSPLWGVPERALAKPGLSDSMTPGGWLDLMADDNPALRVQFFGATPRPEQMYWRGPVLWDFDGRSWTQPQWMSGLPAEPVTAGETVWDYQVELEPTDRRQLVALELLRTAPDDTRLSLDYGLYAPRALNSLTRWRMQSSPPRQFEPQLRQMLRQRALALPAGYNPRTLALAAQWRREAGRNDERIVERALDWVRAEFGYTLDTPLPGRHSVDEFLFEQKNGYCEHFSSAFVVLMRAAGIPSRVVTGYVGGYRNPFGDYWVVRNMDAHAWAEVWLPQRGWVRVDPTAAVAPERIYDTLEDRLGGGGVAGRLMQVGDFGDWLRRGWNDLVLGFDASRQERMLAGFGIDRLSGQRLSLLFALVAALALAWMGWWLARSERERDPLLRAWHRLTARYARRGLGREAHEPALAWAQRIAAAAPERAGELVSLSQRFVGARYAGGVGDRTALIRDLRRHRP